MSDLSLPSNVKLDPNTGLYVITNRDGNTFRVRASTQAQLDTYVQSVNTNFPALVNTTDSDGNPVQRRFDPEAIAAQQNSLRAERALQVETKQATGLIGNRDGTYTDLRTNQTLTKEQAEARVAEAGLPPVALQSITPKNSPTYAAAESAVANVTQQPSNQTSTNGEQPNQAQSGVGQGQTASSPVSLGQNPTIQAATTPPVAEAAPVPPREPVVFGSEIPKTSPIDVPASNVPVVVTERQLSPTAFNDPVDINRLPGGDAALFASATAPGAVDPAFAEELASAARAEEAERQRFLTTNLPVPPDVADQREEDDFDRNPEVEEPGEIGDEDPEVAGLLEQQRALAQADIGQAYSEPEPVPPNLSGIRVSRDDEGNLLPGWAYNEDEGDFFIGGDFIDPAVQASAADSRRAAETKGKLRQAQAQPTLQQGYNQTNLGDWRVRLSLAPGSQYFYNVENPGEVLRPLKATNGIIFPYMPAIQTNYQAKYDSYDLIHSNYRGYWYRNSQVGDITITGIFTAQSTQEAQYVLAVIHFLRSVTKMFYGQDTERGAPPPLCYLNGLGEYQFNNHPVLVSQFNYNLPSEVDYIRVTPNNQGLNLAPNQTNVSSSPLSSISSVLTRLGNANLPKNASPSGRTDLGVLSQTVAGTGKATYVPTKIEIQLTLLPVNTRKQISQEFSLKKYANGELLKKGFW